MVNMPSEFIEVETEDGKTVVVHHWKKGAKASRRLRKAWKRADFIVCCQSASLPAEAKRKSAVYSGGYVYLNIEQGSINIDFTNLDWSEN